jgi:DNA polymerase-3 subunit delta'
MDPDSIPHPRETLGLVGHADAEAQLRSAAEGGRVHHAWLVGGQEGIGKATLAYRFARFLLAQPSERRFDVAGLAIVPESRTGRQVAAMSHPNLHALERPPAEDGKAASRIISVDAARKAIGFFTSTAPDGGRRICIVDAVDDLNAAAANALLKTIEEPPPNALILLVSHSPRRVLPTIRSRCRMLTLRPLGSEDLGVLLAGLAPDADPDLRRKVVPLADGSIRRALSHLDPRRLRLIEDLQALLDGLPDVHLPAMLKVAERVADRATPDNLSIAVDCIQRWLAGRISEGAGQGAARLAPLAEVCESVLEAAREAEIYNLDRRAFIVSTFGDLAGAVRRAA